MRRKWVLIFSDLKRYMIENNPVMESKLNVIEKIIDKGSEELVIDQKGFEIGLDRSYRGEDLRFTLGLVNLTMKLDV